MNKEPSLLKAAWLIAFVIIISKFVGFLRDICIANYYGAGLVSDAYFYAYQIPSLAIILMGGVGGPFHSATVSVFAKLINPDDKMPSEKVNKLFNTFLTSSFILFLLLAVIIFVFSDNIMGFIIHSNNMQLVSLAGNHLRIMTPVILIGGIIGIYYGLLITYKCFLLPNISPTLVSLSIIIIIAFSKGDKFGTLLAIATTIGAILQFLVQVPAVKKLGFKIKPNLNIKNNPEFKNLIELVFPAALSSTIGQIYVYVDMFFASQLREGAWTAIGYANRIFQFPVGILVTAFLVPLFPIFSKLIGEKKFDDVKYYFRKGVGLLNFVALPVMFIIILLAYDVVQIVLQRGEFDASATFMVSQALIFLSLAIIPYVFRDSVTRIFYSFNDSKTPFLVAFSSVILKFILNSLFIDKLGIAAITLSTSLVTLFNAALLGCILLKKINLGYKTYFINLLKMFIAGVLAFSINFIIHKYWIIPPESWIMLVVKTFIIFVLCIVLYILFAIALKIEYAGELIERTKNYIRQKFIH
ncbi:MAG: murein biosynthesis integral membrane protein MurJ [Candidatus Gastranaerophilales bacterium]|nr:murein biosynthesis integral membrane protein MurJ [Candidatus Gastranaerophilales bacterium]